MKKGFLIILLLLNVNFLQAEMSKYQFNFGKIKLEDCILKHKKSGHRKFTGIVDNRYSDDLDWIELEFYFRDKNFNHGREILVSRQYIRDIPKTSHKEFSLYIPLGQIDGRDFRVELTNYYKKRK